MARIDSRLDTILTAIVDRLIAEVTGANAASCYLAIEGEDEISGNPGEFILVVSPGGGNFDDGALDGGGQNQATDYFDFAVKVYSSVMLDQFGRDTTALTDATKGLIAKHFDVLQALTVFDLTDGTDNILRDVIMPRNYEFGRNGRGQGYVRQAFRLSFDWDLT